MSLKAEIETWVEALKAYDDQDFEKSLDQFQRIADSSKILVNIGLIYATLGEHEAAVESFNAATGLDQFLAVAYFQCGVSNFLLGRFDLAYKDFEEAYLYLRGNESIKYEQLGLKFNLYSAEVLFNRGLSQIYLNRSSEGMADLEAARKEKVTPEHDVIDDALRDQGEGYTVFSIPVGVLYRPSENKVKNTKAKDYLGKAKLVAAEDPRDAYTDFSGSTRLKQGLGPNGAYLDQPSQIDDIKPQLLTRAPSQRNSAPSATSNDPFAAPPARGTASDRGISRNPSASSGSIGAGAERRPSLATLGPPRSLSIRRPSAPEVRTAPPPPVPAKADPGSRLTEIYDSYGISEDPSPPPLPAPASERVAHWAQKTSQMTKMRSAGSVISSAPSMRRRPTRRTTMMTTSSRPRRSFDEEEEEGYASGDYDDMPFDLIKIRVKLHYKDDIRGMAMMPEIPFDEFLERVTSKFGRGLNGLSMRFKDDEGGMVSLKDDSDFEMAIEVARESAKGKPEGKLEVWCTDF